MIQAPRVQLGLLVTPDLLGQREPLELPVQRELPAPLEPLELPARLELRVPLAPLEPRVPRVPQVKLEPPGQLTGTFRRPCTPPIRRGQLLLTSRRARGSSSCSVGQARAEAVEAWLSRLRPWADALVAVARLLTPSSRERRSSRHCPSRSRCLRVALAVYRLAVLAAMEQAVEQPSSRALGFTFQLLEVEVVEEAGAHLQASAAAAAAEDNSQPAAVEQGPLATRALAAILAEDPAAPLLLLPWPLLVEALAVARLLLPGSMDGGVAAVAAALDRSSAVTRESVVALGMVAAAVEAVAQPTQRPPQRLALPVVVRERRFFRLATGSVQRLEQTVLPAPSG